MKGNPIGSPSLAQLVSVEFGSGAGGRPVWPRAPRRRLENVGSRLVLHVSELTSIYLDHPVGVPYLEAHK